MPLSKAILKIATPSDNADRFQRLIDASIYLPQLSHIHASLRTRVLWYYWHNNLRRRQSFLPIETRFAGQFAHIRIIFLIHMDGK